MQGGKRDLFEGGIKVPFIAFWPGTIAQGSVSDHLAAFWDFLPTVCELSGAAIPVWTDGISYLPALQGKSQPKHPHFYWEFHELGGKQAVRMGKWKAVRLNVNAMPDGPVMLFDLEKDPLESTDIGQTNPETLQQLTEIMNKERSASDLFPFGDEK
jgi:arylsulfatase A-like enzyme